MSQRRVIQMVAKKAVKPNEASTDTIHDKADIEHLKKLISEKMRDPKTAKKAALIISDMINKKEGK